MSPGRVLRLPSRRAVTLVEILVTAACLMLASLVAMQMLSDNSTFTSWSREALLVREQVDSDASYWETFPFETLERVFSGHHPEEGDLEALLAPIEEERIDRRPLGLEGFREDHRFTRLMGMGVLRTRAVWRGARGSRRFHDSLRLVLDDRNFRPVTLPSDGAALLDSAEEPALEDSSGGDPLDPEGDPGSRPGGDPGGGRGSSWQGVGGQGTAPLDPEGARQTADQLMEMLHDLHHGGDEYAESQDMARRVRSLLPGGSGRPRELAGGDLGPGYDWGRLVGEEDRSWTTDAAPRADFDSLVAVLTARSPPDGDYLYTTQEEAEEGGRGRVLVIYRLVPLEGGPVYLLPKVVLQDGAENRVKLEGGTVLDLGDLPLEAVERPDLEEPVALRGEWAHAEATLRRLYVYRHGYDRDGEPDPFDTVLSLRRFPESLIGDGEVPRRDRELEVSLAPLLRALHLGWPALDARTLGVDTKELFGW